MLLHNFIPVFGVCLLAIVIGGSRVSLVSVFESVTRCLILILEDLRTVAPYLIDAGCTDCADPHLNRRNCSR